MSFKIALLLLLIGFLSVNSQKFGCDFESYCDDLDFDGYWGKTDGADPPKALYPKYDHTFQNSSGHYMFFFFNSQLNSYDSYIKFRQFFNTTDSESSLKLTFSYVISSSKEDQNLTVQLALGDSNDITPTWLSLNTIKNSSLQWSTISLILPKDAYNLNLVFTASKMKSDSVILAIDDVNIQVVQAKEIKAAKVLYYCDFELNNCSYENKMKKEWNRVQAMNNAIFGPAVDHTYNSRKGFYMTTEPGNTSVPAIMQRSVSEVVVLGDKENPYCLSFYYFMQSDQTFFYVYAVKLDSLNDTDPYNKLSYMIWPPEANYRYNYIYKKWSWAIVDLMPGIYRFMFVYASGQLWTPSISIDDVKVHLCPAVNRKRESYALSTFFDYECDFEKDSCGFRNVTSDGFATNWTRISGKESGQYEPPVDHTTSLPSGHFYKVDYRYPIFAKFGALAQSVRFFAHPEMCVQFYAYANSETFKSNLKSQFLVNTAGCYAVTLLNLTPFNSTQSSAQWVRYLLQFRNNACNENIFLTFDGEDFLNMGFAVDDIKINRCDILNATATNESIIKEKMKQFFK